MLNSHPVEAQTPIPFSRRGGRRRGAGRKRTAERRRVDHRTREKVSRHDPILLTVRLMEGLPSLRCKELRSALLPAFRAGSERFGFRLVHYSIQSNHLHFIAEADTTEDLSRGMKGLLVRIARAINGRLDRKGRVFWDRYHSRVLRSPRAVRNAIIYVLQNAKKHLRRFSAAIDSFSSARWFDGWRELAPADPETAPTARARSWLLMVGWRRGHGLLSVHARPAGSPE